jgi:hypothetical protein
MLSFQESLWISLLGKATARDSLIDQRSALPNRHDAVDLLLLLLDQRGEHGGVHVDQIGEEQGWCAVLYGHFRLVLRT